MKKEKGKAFGLAVKPLVEIPVSYIRVPGFQFQLPSMQTLGESNNDSNNRDSATHKGDLDCCLAPVFAFMGI